MKLAVYQVYKVVLKIIRLSAVDLGFSRVKADSQKSSNTLLTTVY